MLLLPVALGAFSWVLYSPTECSKPAKPPGVYENGIEANCKQWAGPSSFSLDGVALRWGLPNDAHGTDAELQSGISFALQMQGFKVRQSDDAGRYLCNYLYYLSLRDRDAGDKRAVAAGHGRRRHTDSLFVHVPPFEHIEKEKQVKFLRKG